MSTHTRLSWLVVPLLFTIAACDGAKPSSESPLAPTVSTTTVPSGSLRFDALDASGCPIPAVSNVTFSTGPGRMDMTVTNPSPGCSRIFGFGVFLVPKLADGSDDTYPAHHILLGKQTSLRVNVGETKTLTIWLLPDICGDFTLQLDGYILDHDLPDIAPNDNGRWRSGPDTLSPGTNEIYGGGLHKFTGTTNCATPPPVTPPPLTTLALSCAPLTQTVAIGGPANFSATGGTGPYSWSAPGSTKPTDSGTTFSTAYIAAGTNTVTVTSGAQTATCQVVVPVPTGDCRFAISAVIRPFNAETATSITADVTVRQDNTLFGGFAVYKMPSLFISFPQQLFANSNPVVLNKGTYPVTLPFPTGCYSQYDAFCGDLKPAADYDLFKLLAAGFGNGNLHSCIGQP